MSGREALVPCAELDGKRRRAVAALVFESFSTYYEKVPLDRDRLLDVLDEELLDANSELGGAVALLSDEEVVGFYAAYPAGEQADRQRSSVFISLAAMDERQAALFLDMLAEHAGDIAPVPMDSYYLARIAVGGDARGSGAAAKLLDAFFAAGKAGPWSLHVHKLNERAIAFYRKHGFAFHEMQDLPYRTMLK